MRAIHLLGLRGEGGASLRLRLDDSGPLVIPWWVPEGDREVLLAFFQQVISDAPLLRVEVEWGRSLLPADRAFLRGERTRHGAEDRFVVVRVRGDDVDLLDVQAQPEIQAFRHVAIVCVAPARNETVRALQQLGHAALLAVEARYEQLAGELDLRADGHAMLGSIHRRLLNPIAAVECFNTLVDLHAEAVPSERHEESVVARVLGRELDHLSDEDTVALAALAMRGDEGLREVFADEADAARQRLRGRMLLRDGRLTGWAEWLREHRFREVLERRVEALATPHAALAKARAVTAWFAPIREQDLRVDPLWARVMGVYRWLNEGKLERAAEELDAIEPELGALAVTDRTRACFWNARGWCWRDRPKEAESAFREALRLLRDGQIDRELYADAKHNLAYSLHAQGRWPEAEPLFREALALKVQGNDAPKDRAVTIDQLARGLRDNGRWPEAERLFRQAITLQEVGKDTPVHRGITLDHLARGLRDNGRWPEAEPLFREALALKEQGAATPASRAATMRAFAEGLRQHGAVVEADTWAQRADALEHGT